MTTTPKVGSPEWRAAQITVYRAGTRVFCDYMFGGKPHGIVLEVLEEGDGRRIEQGKVRVKLTESVGAYKEGEILEVPTWTAVPVKQEFKKAGSFHRWVNTDYRYAK